MTSSAAGAPSETATRDRLLDAAIRVFLANGYARTRVQDIAREAGLTTGAMYAHFENKADLLSAAIAEHGEVALHQLANTMGDDRLGLLGIAAGVHVITGEPEPVHQLMLEALAVAARSDEATDIIEPSLEQMREALAHQIELGREAGLVDESISTEALVAVFQRLVLGSIVAKAIGLPAADPREIEHLVASMLLALVPPGAELPLA